MDVDGLIHELGGYWSPLSMLASITEEVGELAREINHIEGAKKKRVDSPPISIGEELADTIFSLICVANYYHINIEEAFEYILAKYRKRDATRFT